MKVRYTKGDRAGEIAYLGFHEMQAALQAGTVEVINDADEQKSVGEEADRAEIDEGASTEDDGSSGDSDEPDYERMTRAELDELAGQRDVDISGARNKADVIEALKKSA